jgi:hypothetical protein
MKDMRNSFLNFSVPSLMMSEPGNPAKTKLKEKAINNNCVG